MSVEFDTPANRIIQQLQPKNQFRINTSLPDIAFLRQLSVQGRLRYFQQNVSSSALIITPTTGETLFVYKAEFSNVGTGLGTITISNNGNDRWIQVISVNSTGNYLTTDLFDSLVGDDVKTFEVVAVGTNDNVVCSLYGWIENTARIRDVAT